MKALIYHGAKHVPRTGPPPLCRCVDRRNGIESVPERHQDGNSSGNVLRQCVAATRRGDVIRIPGVYAGLVHGFLIGDAFAIRVGQTNVQRLLPELLQHIGNGDLQSDFIIAHHLPLAEAHAVIRSSTTRPKSVASWC